MAFRIWPSQKIRRAIADEIIVGASPISRFRFNPPAWTCVWAIVPIACRPALPGAGRSVAQRLSELATHEVDLARPQVLERNCVHIIPLQERVRLGGATSARSNPKSSSGRLDIFVRLITDGGTAFDEIPEGYEGPLFAEVVPRSFPVIAHAGAALNQIRFRDRASADSRDLNRTMAVSVNLSPMKADGVVAYRARRTSGLVDLNRIGAYRKEEFWESLTLYSSRKELVLVPDEFYILASLEDIRVEAHEAAEMIAYDTSVGEVRVHYAGFLDPGFGLPDLNGMGSKIVLEVRSHDVPFLLDHGQRVGTLLFEEMLDRPDILYGESIRSNYQGQGLRLSKQFI